MSSCHRCYFLRQASLQALRLAREQLRVLQEEEKRARQREYDAEKLQAEREIANARDERATVREQIADAYAAQAAQERRSTALGDEIWQAQLERVEEDLLFKKLRLEKASARSQLLQEQLQDAEGQLKALNSELSRRDTQSEALLHDALERADVLREALGELERGGSDLHQQWLQAHAGDRELEGAATKDFSLVDELQAQRQQKHRKASRDKAEALRAMNRERWQLGVKQREAVARAHEIDLLVAKGDDFLADVELGEGPPIEFVKMNLSNAVDAGKNHGVEQLPGGNTDEALDDMISRLKNGMVAASQEVAHLARAVAVQPERQRLPGRLNLHSESYRAASGMLGEIVDDAWKQVYVFVPPRDTVEKEEQWWKTQGQTLQKEMRRRKLANLAWQVLSELTEELVVSTVGEIDKEIAALGSASSKVSDGILLSSIDKVCASRDASQVSSAHDEIAKQAVAGACFKHSMTMTWWVPAEGSPMPRPRKPVLKPWDVRARKLAQPDDLAFYPRSDSSHDFAVKQCGSIKKAVLSGRAGISCMQLSSSGHLVCIGRTNGEVSVWSCPDEKSDAVLLRKHSPASAADGDIIVEIGWSVDSSQFYTINHRGIVVLWSMQIQPGTKSSKIRKLWRVAQLDPTSLAPPPTLGGTAVRGATESVPSTGCFHPSLTTLGSQPSIVLGMTNGDVVKCTTGQSGILLNGDDLSVACGTGINAAPGENSDMAPRFTHQETFAAHKEKVLFADYGYDDTLVTFDNDGHRVTILRWPYRRGQFTGFGWFHPDRSCHIGLDHCFTCIGEPENVFPASTIPANPLLDPNFLSELRTASESVATLKDLAVAPCSHRTTETGSLELVYPPKEVGDPVVQCTVLEYGVTGAGAGLLLRHSKLRHEVSAASRGAIAPKSRNHAAFSPCRRKLYILCSEETAQGDSALVVVGLAVDTMKWLPIRVEVGRASATSRAPALSLSVHASRGNGDALLACVLNGGKLQTFSLGSGQPLNISVPGAPRPGTWDTMSGLGTAASGFALSCTDPPEVSFWTA